MKGVITLCLKEVVQEKHGPDKWGDVIAQAGYDKEPTLLPISDVKDELFFNLLDAATNVLELPRNQVLENLGEYWVTTYSQKIYKPYYETAESAKELLSQMDKIHKSVTQNSRGASPPRFDYHWENDKCLVMTYKSSRGMIDYMAGTIKGVGKLFNENLTVTKLDEDQIKVVFS